MNSLIWPSIGVAGIIRDVIWLGIRDPNITKTPNARIEIKWYTLSPISVSGFSTVCYKTILNTGSVGWAGAPPPTYKLGKFLSWPLALSMSTYSNFQINGASGETLKPPDPRLLKQNRGLEVSTFLPKLYLFGNCYKSTYLGPRAMTKTSPIYK